MGTTPASTDLTGQHGENGPAPLLSQRGVIAAARPPLANSAVNSFVSVHVGSHGNFSALELRSPFVLPSPQQGLPSSSYSLSSPDVCPLRTVSQLTPINVDRFQHELCDHPNPDKVAYVVQALRDSFHLGFNYSTSLKSATGNMASALLNPQVIDSYLQSEVQTGRVAGPFSQPVLPVLHVSRFGVIPKRHQPGKWRLILDLTSPAGHTVNDGIVGEDYSLQYMKVDDIIAGIMRLGQSSLMAKYDVQNASQHRSLRLSSTRNFSLSSWQLTSGVPSGPPNGSTSYQITAQWWTFCGLALQEPLPSCPWFATCPCWQLVTPSRSLPPQLEGSLTPLLTPYLAFSFSAFTA